MDSERIQAALDALVEMRAVLDTLSLSAREKIYFRTALDFQQNTLTALAEPYADQGKGKQDKGDCIYLTDEQMRVASYAFTEQTKPSEPDADSVSAYLEELNTPSKPEGYQSAPLAEEVQGAIEQLREIVTMDAITEYTSSEHDFALLERHIQELTKAANINQRYRPQYEELALLRDQRNRDKATIAAEQARCELFMRELSRMNAQWKSEREAKAQRWVEANDIYKTECAAHKAERAEKLEWNATSMRLSQDLLAAESNLLHEQEAHEQTTKQRNELAKALIMHADYCKTIQISLDLQAKLESWAGEEK